MVVKDYSETDVDEDNNSMTYEQAYQEAHYLDEIKKKEQMAIQQAQLLLERTKIEEAYK